MKAKNKNKRFVLWPKSKGDARNPPRVEIVGARKPPRVEIVGARKPPRVEVTVPPMVETADPIDDTEMGDSWKITEEAGKGNVLEKPIEGQKQQDVGCKEMVDGG